MITRKQYVARLEKILKMDKPCVWCPGDSGFGNFHVKCENICKLCYDFVNIEVDGPERDDCPCFSFARPSTALKRAGKALMQWKAGRHKWQR